MEPTSDVIELIRSALREDLGDAGDITSQATIPEDKTIKAVIQSREDGVLAGIDIARKVFEEVDATINFIGYLNDGDTVKQGQDILSVEGNARNILMAERTALNFLSHLSGVATETAKYVEAVRETNTRILDTRKTLPGYRTLHKHAVKMGGGTNHRIGLHDAILIKDNHIAASGSIQNALDNAKTIHPDINIEIEVDTLEQLQEVLDNGSADIVMLDNMPAEDLKTAVEMAKDTIKTEASGGITLESIVKIAESGVDYISIGALTHSVKALDIGLDIDG